MVEQEELDESGHEEKQAQEPEIEKKRLPGVMWYAVRTYSGHERKVKEAIDKEIEKYGIQDKMPTVYIPYERFVEVKDGKKKSRMKNAFPGYILVEMILDKQTKSVVMDAPSIIGFLGVDDQPTPLRPDEIKRLLEPEQDQERKSVEKAPFEVGGAVKIIDGPFSSLTGVVQEVNTEKMKVKVMINFFGRSTPTEVDFSQVKLVAS